MLKYYLLTILSVLMETTKNVIFNGSSKTYIKNNTDIYKFNTFMYIGTLPVMLVILLMTQSCSISVYTVVLAFLFALASSGMQTTLLQALKHGPLSFVNFIQTSGGLVIPSLFGAIFLKQGISVIQTVALFVLVISMAMIMNLKKGDTGKTLVKSWLPNAVVSMICCGGIGIIQSLFQSSDYNNEIYEFLTITFIFIILLNFIQWKFAERKNSANFSMRSKVFIQPIVSGAFMGIVNVLNLFLIGVMPSIIFFPLANGGLLILTILAAIVFFRERIKAIQWIGIILGLVCMCMFGI